jgi:hypothetical protein
MESDGLTNEQVGAIAKTLIGLADDELLEVLRLVFTERRFAPEEAAFLRSRYFLGIATSQLQDDESQPEPPAADQQIWANWEIEAAAYPDMTEYGSWRGPGYGFADEGECGNCHTRVRGLLKKGICPICGSRVSMT